MGQFPWSAVYAATTHARKATDWGRILIGKPGHRRLVAWLAVFAMWLTIVAPVVSQTIAATSWSPDLGSWCEGHAGLVDHPAPHQADPHAPTTDKCGYCGLLGHSPTLAGASWQPPLPILQDASALTIPPPRTAHTTRALLAAAPRGPPAYSHA